MEIPFKNFIQRGEKYIVVEGGKPEYVVMHYDDYQELIARKGSDRPLARPAGSAPRGFPEEPMLSGAPLPEDISKIRLEDLPL